jgi:proteasome accessory factor A
MLAGEVPMTGRTESNDSHDNRKTDSLDSGRGEMRGRLRRRPPPDHPLVSRLVGLETEYATLVADEQDLDNADLPPSHMVYAQICEAIRRDQPTVSGLYDSEQMFLANGGAVTFESHPSMHALPGGLVEIATPEVRSPDDLLACQRSIDSLAADAAADSETSFDLRALKNSSDALGHVYGCHENYDAEVASGIWLLIYRCFIMLLWCMQVVSLVVSLPLMAIIFFVVMIFRLFKGVEFSVREPHDMFEVVPDWLSAVLITALRVIHFPTVLVLRLVARRVAFRRQRRYLTAFLVSRVAMCGSGNLDHDGRYQMSAKAMAIDSVADMGGFRGERPIYVYGHWLGQFCAKSFMSLASTRQMFRRRQRLQIGLSDSNLSDLAEYVKVGSVSLLLDMIESRATNDLPILKRPLHSLARIASDWNLISRVPTSRGQMSAIEIQKVYLKAAQRFVDSTPANMRGEAALVLYRWRELLDAVIAFRKDASDVDSAIGRVDWLSKRWLIDKLGEDADWAARKKVDLRYHELSEDGYYYQLMTTRPDLRLVDDEQIERRRRSPPPSSPAARRGWLIREFANSDESMQSEWSYAIIGRGRRRRRVEFVKTSRSS